MKVVIKNFPLSFHKQAYKAAQYVSAAQEQGKYKELYHKVFENYKKLKNNEDLPLELGEVVYHRDGTTGVYVKDPFGNYLEYIWYSDDQKGAFLSD